MNKKHIFSLFVLFFCNTIVAEFDINSTLILNYRPDWVFEGSYIRKNPKYSFKKCVHKWQRWFEKMWQPISEQIADEFVISQDHFSVLFFEKNIREIYFSTKDSSKEFFEKSDCPITQYIKKTLALYTAALCKVILTGNMGPSTSTRGLGAEHIVQCNNNFFNKENIAYIESPFTLQNFYFTPQERADIQSSIDVRNLASLILAVSGSQINHNQDFFNTVVHNFTINQKTLSEEIQLKFSEFCHLRNTLEAVFQSVNPLEAAWFFYSTITPGSPYEDLQIKFWEMIIKDLENCYHPDDLEAYYSKTERNTNPFEEESFFE